MNKKAVGIILCISLTASVLFGGCGLIKQPVENGLSGEENLSSQIAEPMEQEAANPGTDNLGAADPEADNSGTDGPDNAVEYAELESNEPVIEDKGTAVPVPVETTLPEAEWLRDVSFPAWRGYIDDTLALNDMMSFDYYSGQGKIYIAPDSEVTGFDMYINNKKTDTSGLIGGRCYEIDISGISVNGKNTVQISNVTPFSEDINVRLCVPYPVVIEAAPEDAGINPDALKLISEIIESDVEEGFTSSQLAVIRYGRLVYENAWGYTDSYTAPGQLNPEPHLATKDTLYDVASITKMAVVNLAIEKLITDGYLSAEDKVSDIIGPEFHELVLDFGYNGREYVSPEQQKKWKSGLTIKDILCHEAGFPPDPKYYNPNVDAPSQVYGAGNTNVLFSGNGADEETKAATLTAICKTPLMYEPGTQTIYSDVDYMLLGFVIEKITGMDLNAYMKENFWNPLGLERITYNPLENGFTKDDCATTELSGNTREGLISFEGIRSYALRGEVHDEKAFYSMGGVSGHAGLFSNAGDLARLLSLTLTGGYGGKRFFSPTVTEMFTAPKDEDTGSWGLGWFRAGDLERVNFFGTQSGTGAYGHQGWTGCIVIVDPERELVIVYLTNKIGSGLINKYNSTGRFRGGAYTSATLGFVPQILSVGMDCDEDIKDQLTSLCASITREAVELIPENPSLDNPYINNAKSKLKLLKRWCEEQGRNDYDAVINEVEGLLSKY